MIRTEKLYQEDPYLKECTATVTGVADHGVILDRSVFYCQGGGQPGDTGVLVLSDGSSTVSYTHLTLPTPPYV